MALFVIALQQVQESRGEQREGNARQLLGAERRSEAEIVGPCATRFVELEMDPERERTVALSFYPEPLGAGPSLAEQLGAKLTGAHDSLLTAVRLAVHKALASGYLAAVEREEGAGVRFCPERSAEEVWHFWMLNFRVRLEDAGIPNEWAKWARAMGSDLLVSELKELGLIGFLGASKLNRLGVIYTQAGVHLRMAQTDITPDYVFRHDVRLRRTLPGSQRQPMSSGRPGARG